MKLFRVLTFLILLLAGLPVSGQIILRTSESDTTYLYDTDSLRRAWDRGPAFGAYKDNYFIFGTAVGPKPTKANTNVKFQISIQQRLTRSTLPWHTYLYLFYTQKVFWHVLENSMPMTDLNFNPGIGLAKPFFSSQDGRYIGKLMLVLEHESNGRDGEESRSWNRVTLGGNIYLDRNIMVNAKIWCPIIDGVNNKDILKYCGLYQCGIQVMSNNRRFGASLWLTKRLDWNPLNYNAQLELRYRCFPADNLYLFFQYYNGYGEGLLDYNKYTSEARIGICLTPTWFSDF